MCTAMLQYLCALPEASIGVVPMLLLKCPVLKSATSDA